MNKNKNKKYQHIKPAATKPVADHRSTKSAERWHNIADVLPYVLTFILVWIFCSDIYGDMLTRAQQETYVSSHAVTMKFLTDKEWGTLYWGARYLMLAFRSALLGGLLLATLLTLAVWAMDRFLCLPKYLRGLSALLPFALLGWMVSRGYSLFYKNEPSVIVLYPLLLALGTLLLAGIVTLVKRFSKTPVKVAETTGSDAARWKRWPVAALIPVVGFATLTPYTLCNYENEIITARMQNRILTGDIDEIALLVDDGLSAKQPTRSVAAYYAVGLMQTHQLLNRIFEIPFKYPEMPLDQKDGNEEYGIFEADCDFFTGLINPAYRAAMDKVVMNGPTIYQLKRMALCAIVSEQKNLARKYLKTISEMPFEQDFVDRYAPMVDDPQLIEQDPMLAEVLKLKPEESRFEQNYRRPIFMGYNIGLMSGSNEAIDASIAACLYSKDLVNFLPRAGVLKSIGRPLPQCVKEAIVIHGIKHPEAFEMFPELAPSNNTVGSTFHTVQSFILAIQNYYKEKYGAGGDWQARMMKDLKGGVPEEVRDALAPEWLGHYVYYYYCENIKKKEQGEHKDKSGVN